MVQGPKVSRPPHPPDMGLRVNRRPPPPPNAMGVRKLGSARLDEAVFCSAHALQFTAVQHLAP